MDGDAFKTYTAEILAPTLAPGDIVVMDNLPAHKVAGIAETFAKRNAQLFYLPPYSPDMNPIEMAFSKLKTALRAEPARTIDTLWRRIAAADKRTAIKRARIQDICASVDSVGDFG